MAHGGADFICGARMAKVRCGDKVYEDYAAYINSHDWKLKRKEFFKSSRFWGCCVVCGSKKRLEVHHMHYGRIGREGMSDLTCLCHKCHAKFHDKTPRRERKRKKSKAQRKIEKQDKRRQRVKPLWCGNLDRSSGKVKRFTKEEIAEYERQQQHMQDI